MKFAYADPPYVGMAKRYPEKTEVDHSELIERLERDYPDGWALSASAPSLALLLPLCPPKTRVGAWVKTWCPAVMNVRPVYGWEPVLFRGGRRIKENLTVDWHRAAPAVGQRVLGAKPESFCMWVFQLLGMRPGDELDDLYPGSGAVGRAWEKFCGQLELKMA